VTVRERVKFVLNSVSNVHRQGTLPNVFLFATPRGGSTWMMEILSSQPGMKYYDEPFNLRRANVKHTGLFDDYRSLMPEGTSGAQITEYLNALRSGEYAHMNPPPYRPGHRFFTNRIVFKIHELEHLIGEIAERCQGQIVYLLRHPIPTTQSRRVFPRLELFLGSPYYDRLLGATPELKEIKRLGTTGNHLQRGTVSWCYENVIPLKDCGFNGLLIAYEEMTLNPQASCDLLLKFLRFTDRAAMLAAFDRAAANIKMSPLETQSMMKDSDDRRRRNYLVNKWVAKTTPQDATDVTAIMELFGLDVYRGDQLLPHHRYLHFAETPQLLDPIAPPAPVAVAS
jgi:hypothetical protein